MSIFKDTMHVWWAKPSIRTDENEEIERKATWLELFYDLSFVAILAQLSHMLVKVPTWELIGQFVFLFIASWWIWNSATFYNERYERNDVRHRVLTFISMFPLAGIAYSIRSGLDQSSGIFAVSYIASRVLLIYMWLSAAHSKIEKQLSRQFAVGFLISVALWSISLFFTGSPRFILWGTGLLIDMITPMFTLKTQTRLPKISSHHIPERFGLFIILTIGETVIGAINGFASNKVIDFWISLTCALGLLVSFLIWWLYVDQVLYRVFKKKMWNILAWAYLHLPLAIGIVAVGAAIYALVTTPENLPVAGPIRWLLCGSLGFTLIVISLITLTSENEGHQEKIIEFHQKHLNSLLFTKLTSAGLCLLLGFLGSSLQAVSLLGLLIVILFIPIINSVSIWVKSHLKKQIITT